MCGGSYALFANISYIYIYRTSGSAWGRGDPVRAGAGRGMCMRHNPPLASRLSQVHTHSHYHHCASKSARASTHPRPEETPQDALALRLSVSELSEGWRLSWCAVGHGVDW